ncbi:MAG TPA: chromosome partitioning protein ParB, partial [bacterium]|nr:chromosome partitioning protein ParB [bacterium]
HARALLGLEDPKLIELAFAQILRENLSVRQVEQLVQKKQVHVRKRTQSMRASPKWQKQERELMTRLGTKVAIREKRGKGRIEVNFYSPEELHRLIHLLSMIQE